MDIKIYERVAKRVEYDKETGEMLWKFDPSKPKSWNTQRAGKQVGSVCQSGRVTRDSNGNCVLTRRLAYFIVTGELPEIVETLNGDNLDDSFSNLKVGDYFSKAQKSKRSVVNLSGVSGVYKHPDRDRYCVRIECNKKTFFKTFKSKSDAEACALEKRRELGFNDLHGRG